MRQKIVLLSRASSLALLLTPFLLPAGCADRDRPPRPDLAFLQDQGPGEGEGEGGGEGEGSTDRDLGPERDAGDLEQDGGSLAGYLEECQENGDCQSGWCVAYAGRHVCTRPCTEECDGGWLCRVVGNQGSDVVSICMPPDDRLCAPCTSVADCEGGLCVAVDPLESRLHCTQPCIDGGCREGFVCSTLVIDGTSYDGYCLPATGTCTCTAGNAGMDRLCSIANVFGTCLGREVCTPELGWEGCNAPTPVSEVCNQQDDDCNGFADDIEILGDPCTREAMLADGLQHVCQGTYYCAAGQEEPQCSAAAPVEEICNLRDDDCDDEVDEDFPELGETCFEGVGTCLRAGAVVCDELTGGTRCLAEAGQGSEERCNGVDDDCDGQTDEDFRDEAGQRYVALEHCGSCGVSCEGLVANGESVCDASGPVPVCGIGSCAPGFYQAGPTLCLPFEDPSCEMCASDLNCQMPGNRCLELDGARFCGRDCAEGNLYGTDAGSCPAGYRCQDLPELGEGVRQCVPESGSCTCLTDDDQGTTRSCLAVSDAGRCAGLQVCTLGQGWSACSAPPPGPEVCNGLDDDCDLRIDEELTAPEEPCVVENEHGRCTAPWTCRGEEGWQCDAPTPVAETCDYQDNDCDGETDEGFRDALSGLYLGVEHCGRCGASCAGTILYATEIGCAVEDEQAVCVALACEPDFFVPPETRRLCLPSAGGFDCSPCLGDALCQSMPGGRCEQVDEATFCTRGCEDEAGCPGGFDCLDGRCLPANGSCSCRPQRAGATRLCQITSDAGTCLGSETCDPLLGWVGCSAAQPAPEACNGVDDDCDLLVDEELVPPQDLECKQESEFGSCIGELTCGGAQGWLCGAQVPSEERCDYQDNDCDGLTDEGFLDEVTGRLTTLEHCGVCGYSCVGRIPNAAVVRCDAASELPVCEVVTCSPGFYRASASSCVPVTSNRCAPCQTDRNCPVQGDRCVDLDGARVCGQDCAPDNLHGTPAGTCPSGFTCTELGEGVQQCLPVSGSCSCLPEHEGSTRQCQVANGLGICTGFQTCLPETGWSDCSATAAMPERCDGVDNDCDGSLDEGFAGLNQPCQDGLGACLRAGVVRCNEAGDGTECGARAGDPEFESCNYQDDDCDGTTDEDFKDEETGLYVGQEHCGLCNASCDGAILFSLATECRILGASAICVATECEQGYQLTENGRLCVPPSGVDDCSQCTADQHCASLPGGLCEAFADGRFCTRGCGGELGDCPADYDCVEGRCWPTTRSCTCLPRHAGAERVCYASNVHGSCIGTQTCDPALSPGWQPCTARIPAAEICDGQDNDCNNLVDEGVVHPVGLACSVSNDFGTCSGIQLCRGVDGWSCTAETPAAETCNGIDDDCDGDVDEDWPELQFACFAGQGACRSAGVTRCRDDGAGTECTAVAGQAEDEICDLQDNDCDGQVDEGFADLYQACTVGRGICLSLGVRVCTLDGSGTECDAEEGPSADEVCNGLDDDCDGVIDDPWADELYTACTVGVGVCQNAGVKICTLDGQGTRCDVEPRPAQDEVCDGLDNDCDGTPDDGPLWENKGQPCTAGLGACVRSGIYICDPDHRDGPTICTAQAGEGRDEICNGIDDDCDGQIDEAPLLDVQLCDNQRGICAGAVKTCGGARGWLDCNSSNYPADFESTETLCDLRDNDCDGQVDESLVGPYCQLQAGVCAGKRQTCVTGQWVACGPAQYGADFQADEDRCDLLDNDCDGATDDGWLNAGRYDQDEACGNCFTDCTTIYAKPNAFGRCDLGGPSPQCKMICRPGHFDLNQIPDDGCEFTLDPLAIYVSSSGAGSDGLPGCGLGPVGTGEGHRPCQTLAQGRAEANLTGRTKLIVADGLYEETLTLQKGLDVLGGHRADTWERHLGSTMTILRGLSSDHHKKTVIGQGIDQPTTLQGFVIYGPSNYDAGGNSYALWLLDCTAALTVANNVIYGGFAAAGQAGDDGEKGEDGTPGIAGQDTITTTTRSLNTCNALATTPGNQGAPGDPGQHSCGGDNVNGGAGAGANCPSGNNQQPNGTAGQPGDGGAAGGSSGIGGYDRTTDNCGTFNTGGQSATGMPGGNGGDGAPGLPGTGCSEVAALGSVQGNEWVGATGSGGTAGRNGGGGGGGGAGGGADVTDDCSGVRDCLGGSGGGGGGGGCGGSASGGGGAGGGAFGIFVSFSAPSANLPNIASNQITRGVGGDGGAGGLGGTGGVGGDGANGGNVSGQWAYAMGQGGRGGQGGAGGHGGGGGGGCGGVSYGIYVHNYSVAPAAYRESNAFLGGGLGGAPGKGGPSLGADGSDGHTGVADDLNF